MDQFPTFSKGEWIVHHYYGVGQVRGLETKTLDGEEAKYYKVKTRNSMFWVPVEGDDSSRLRPLSSPKEIKKVIRLLKGQPKSMDSDHIQRKKLIREVNSDGSLADTACLIRDLSARQKSKRLNPTEEDALKRFRDRLLREWAVCMELEPEEAKSAFQECLKQGLAKASAT